MIGTGQVAGSRARGSAKKETFFTKAQNKALQLIKKKGGTPQYLSIYNNICIYMSMYVDMV